MLDRWVSTTVAQQVVVGPGALRQVGEVARALGLRRLLLVTTPGRARSEGMAAVRSALGRTLAGTFEAAEADVPASVVQAGVRAARGEGFDGLVSFGGGAAVDTAKAMAFFLEHESGTPAAGFADRPLLPHIAIPTTLVGAAFSSWMSVIDPATRRSSTAGAPTVAPVAVVVEPEVGADLDAGQLSGSVAAVLGHGVEALWAPGRTPETDALATAGLAHLARAAPLAVAEPGDLDRRGGLLDAAVLCGRARARTGDGLHHALAQLLAARASVPYGAVQAALLPATARFTFEAVPAAADAVSRALAAPAGVVGSGPHPADSTDPEATTGGPAVAPGSVDRAEPGALIAALLDALGPRPGLSDLGLDGDDLDAVARQAGSHRGVQVHPRPVGEADVRALLDDAW